MPRPVSGDGGGEGQHRLPSISVPKWRYNQVQDIAGGAGRTEPSRNVYSESRPL